MVVVDSIHTDGMQDGMEDISQDSVRGAGVPAIHHSWCASVLHEWG
jgi:hypothetical protein